MSIVSFKCHGFTHLITLRGIQTVELTPKSKLQMILGTNGSGKSALLSQLSQLPASREDYIKGGYKQVVISRHGSEYECLSDFTGVKSHYSIKKDGEVLVTGHSSIVYLEKIREIFGITPEIHAVRTGAVRFSSMDVAFRRQWFTKLCPQDYSYSIGFYKRLSENTRDISGAIKRTNSRLMAEKAKLISPEEELKIREDIKQLTATRNDMMQYWQPMRSNVEQTLEQVDQIDAKLDDLNNAFTKTLKVICHRQGYKTQDDIWKAISSVQANIQTADARIDELCDIIEKNRELLSQVCASADRDIDRITADLAEVSRRLTSNRLNLLHEDWDDRAVSALSAYQNIAAEISTLLLRLNPDPLLKNSHESYQNDTKRLAEIQVTIQQLSTSQNKVFDRIEIMEHRKKEGHTQCPSCQHVWIRGFSEALLKEERDQAGVLGEQIEKLTQEHQHLTDDLQQRLEQLQTINRVLMIARATSVLDPMWKRLSEDNFMQRYPDKAIAYINSVKVEIETSIERTELRKQQAELIAFKNAAIQTSGINQQDLLDKNTSLEARLSELQISRRENVLKLERLRAIKQAMEFQDQYINSAEDLLIKRDALLKQAEDSNHHDLVNSIIMQLGSEITEKGERLSQINSQHHLIESLEAEVQTYTDKEKLMKKAMSCLSPSEGLIAKGLTGFINHFINQMNALIEKVWLYPLTIDPIKVDEDSGIELKYRFPFQVDNKKAGADISEASGAQKEIFDIAFMLVSMVHLGLDDTEVFLDEFSIRMDYAHRREAMKMIMDLIHSSNFSQIFMVSHYESSYGSLPDADITVLCSENIELPSDLRYNINSSVEY